MPNSFHAISIQDGKRFTPENMLDLHRADAAYLWQKPTEPFDGRTIVLPHHRPHSGYTTPAYAARDANYLLACSAELVNDILYSDAAPDLWICGVKHHVSDIQIGQSCMVRNLYGYKREQARNGFRWDCPPYNKRFQGYGSTWRPAVQLFGLVAEVILKRATSESNPSG